MYYLALVAAAVLSRAQEQLVVPIHVATLDAAGRLAIPADKYLVVEVGANTQNTVDQTLLPVNADAFVLTFEPLLDKYGSLLARNSAPDTYSPLGFHHPRGIVLPMAIASGEPFAWRSLRVHDVDGCSSLLEGDCGSFIETRGVPTVPLRHVLDVWLGGRRVDYVKIDAQGADLDVVRSAGPSLRAVASLSVEVPADGSPTYAGELTCSAMLDELALLGLSPVGAKRMHEARFTRVNFTKDGTWRGCETFLDVKSIEILLCHSPGCVPDMIKVGEQIFGVRRATL